MIRLNSSICVALSVCLLAGSPGIQAAEVAKYDDGPFVPELAARGRGRIGGARAADEDDAGGKGV
jgi:hypothetical protein